MSNGFRKIKGNGYPINNIQGMNMNYDNEWFLTKDQYINDIADQMNFESGKVLLISDVGTGKTHNFVGRSYVLLIAPLISIVQSVNEKNDGQQAETWNSRVAKVLNAKDKTIFSDQILVIDECHGMYQDFSFKEMVINDIMKIIPYFKGIVFMSGTIKPEWLSAIHFDRIYRVHKASEARKEITQYICMSDMKTALEQRILASKGQRKAIALVNDVDLCNRIQRQYGPKALVVCSDLKNDKLVQQFYKSKAMTFKGVIDGEYVEHDYSLIIGTDSIREGLSIEDKLEEVDVFVYGSTPPETIEQFSNRFRNVSRIKNVHYLTHDVPHRDSVDFNIDALRRDVTDFCQIVNYRFDNFESETYRDIFKNNYGKDLRPFGLVMNRNTGQYEVNEIFIDAEHYKHREEQYRCDSNLFKEVITNEYGFHVNMFEVLDVAKKDSDEQKLDMKKHREADKLARIEMLESLIENFNNGSFEVCGINDEYDYVRTAIGKLISDGGLKPVDIERVIRGYITDKNFIAKVWVDSKHITNDTSMRDFIRNYIEANQYNENFSKNDLAVLTINVIQKVCKELFLNDEKLMANHTIWKAYIEYSESSFCLVLKRNKAKEVIEQYIQLDSKQVRVDGERERLYSVKDYSLTSIVLDGVKVTEPELLAAVDFRKRLAALRA